MEDSKSEFPSLDGLQSSRQPSGRAASRESNDDHASPCGEEGDYARELTFLARAIVENRAVVYVGSGASAPVDLPLWSELLKTLYVKGAKPLLQGDREGLKHLADRIKNKQYLEAADLLQDILDNDLQLLLWEQFEKSRVPSSIHRNIARLPFTMAITTNYDRLLESSYRKSQCTVLTWRDAHSVLGALQSNRFVVLKTHGAIGDGPSLILSTREYRNLMYANPLFWQVMKWIFMTKTCLFVGASLEDSDLIQLFHEAITECGQSFGPHYALLPEDESPTIRANNLEHSLRIRVVRIKKPKAPQPEPKPDPCVKRDVKRRDTAWIEPAVSRALVALSGEVARLQVDSRPPMLPSSNDPLFYCRKAVSELLEKALEVTGSLRGDICLLSGGTGGHLLGKLRYVVSQGPTTYELEGKNQEVDENSVCGIAFHKPTNDHVYIKNVEHAQIESAPRAGSNHYGPVGYRIGHTDVRSELAVPIHADGVRVGVLNLESRLVDAYAEGHFHAAHWFADKMGRLVAATQERDRRGRWLSNELVERIYPGLRELLDELVALIDRNGEHPFSDRKQPDRRSTAFMIFRADYREGRLIAQNVQTVVGDPILGKEDFELIRRVEESASKQAPGDPIKLNVATPSEPRKICQVKNKQDQRRSRAFSLCERHYEEYKSSLDPQNELIAPDSSVRIDPVSGGACVFCAEDRPCFHFDAVSLTTKVFTSQSAIRCIDPLKASDKPKLIDQSYRHKLGLTGTMLGFPMYVRSYIAGVMILWRPWGKPGDLDWRHMELFRRAAHLIANAGLSSRLGHEMDGSASSTTNRQENEPPRHANSDPFFRRRVEDAWKHIEGTRAIIQIFQATEWEQLSFSKKSLPESEECDPALAEDWLDVAVKMGELLVMLWRRYEHYSRQWLVPTRCRLRVRDKTKAREGAFRFGLVLEVALNIESYRNSQTGREGMSPQWFSIKNLYESPNQRSANKTKVILVTEPTESTEAISKVERRLSSKDVPGHLELQNREAFTLKSSGERQAFVGEADRYLSFLLSWINADRFARIQWPSRNVPDPYAETLQKDPKSPWYVAPICVVQEKPDFDPTKKNEPAEGSAPELESEVDLPTPSIEKPAVLEIEKAAAVDQSKLRELVAYLTFDGGAYQKDETKDETGESGRMAASTPAQHGDGREPEKDSCEASEEHVALQNELIHTLDLFTACLAEGREFQEFQKQLHEPGSQEKAAAAKA